MKQIVKSEKAPAALGPYSHAVAFGELVFTSGQLGIDPATGKFAEGVEAQARQALENLRNVLEASGCSLADAVKTTVFVVDLADFAKVNAVYAAFFGPDYPARSCVQVAALPGGGLVECECVAVKSAR
ncbi:MAG TPA: RidA family protein [Clostridia bacterium]|nr:MAG: RutC family protein [Firmicutes bacterium ADurb.Bin248]HOF99495.1 RidA family protein [Clostridia bacterium]HOS17915.1 RidA family protein [Clostridia bacterium]HPK15188.1 RidA family protein [Clostridia bacterium]